MLVRRSPVSDFLNCRAAEHSRCHASRAVPAARRRGTILLSGARARPEKGKAQRAEHGGVKLG